LLKYSNLTVIKIKMTTVRHLGLLEIKLFNCWYCSQDMHQHAKFRAGWSNHCRDMAVFLFLQAGGCPPSWILKCSVRFRG